MSCRPGNNISDPAIYSGGYRIPLPIYNQKELGDHRHSAHRRFAFVVCHTGQGRDCEDQVHYPGHQRAVGSSPG
jgi:hypothetical protein